ncbi:MAG TPA: DUF4340 domain-containing protein [Burkholderiales bacterium]|jgi:hypothetical protein
MSRVGWLNAALAVLVVALGAFLYLGPARDAAVEYPLSALKPGDALTLRVERAGAMPVVLEKKQDGWFVTAPFTARADETRVQRLLEIVGARAAHRFPAGERGRFGLEPPQARIVVDGQAFGFGLVNDITREQYVMAGDAVYAVHPRYGLALPAAALDAASRQLLASREMPVRIEGREFTVAEQDGRWVLTPGAGDLSQDDLIRWVDEWRLASALRVQPQSAKSARETFRIHLKSGASFTLGVVAREPELVLARSDETLQYHFRAELAKRLLSPPAARDEFPAQK